MSEQQLNNEKLEKLVNWRLQQLQLNDEQYKAVTLDKGNIVVSAAAGSGKTYTMTERIMCRVLKGQAQLSKLLILTFTEKASLNMQEALQRKIADIRAAFVKSNLQAEIGIEVYKAAFNNLLTAENELNFAQISTIHAFCKQLISDTAYLANEDIAMQAISVKQAKIADEAASNALLMQAAKRLLNYVMQVSKAGEKLVLGNFSQEIESILPNNISVSKDLEASSSKKPTVTNDLLQTEQAYQELISRSNLQGDNLTYIWQALLAQVNARKNLDNLLTSLITTYKQFRTYPDYREKLQQAAVYADKKANNLKLAPEYLYFLKELQIDYNNFKKDLSYLKTHLATAVLTKKTATESEIAAVNAYLVYLVSEIESKLAPMLASLQKLSSVKKHFSLGLTADSELALEENEELYELYQAIVDFGRSLANPPELSGKKGTQAFKFDGRVKLSEADLHLKTRYIATVGPLLQLLAPHIKLISDTEVKKFSNIQTELANFDLGQETYLAKEQASKIVLWVELLLALDTSYSELKQAKQLIDFSDLEQTAYKLLQDANVTSYCQEHYQEIYVDEYQDTSNIQEAILQKLAKDNLFVVGDIKQSIYAFRNAKLANFQNKLKLAQQKTADRKWQLVNFNTNYRSVPEVLSFCNLVFQSLFQNELLSFDYIEDKHYFQAAVISTNEQAGELNAPKVEILNISSLNKELDASCNAYKTASSELIASSKASSDLSTIDKLLKTSNKFTVKQLEAYLIANKIKDLLEQASKDKLHNAQAKAPTIAVLARSHATLEKLAKVLKECKIPYILGSSKNDLAEENKEKVSLQANELYFLLQALANLADDETLCTVLSSSYLEQPLSFEDLAEIKAASLDYLTDSLEKNQLADEQVALLKSIRYLPYKDVLNLYLAAYNFSLQECATTTAASTTAASTTVASTTADSTTIAATLAMTTETALPATTAISNLLKLFMDKLPNFLANYARYIKKDLAIKLDLNLAKLARWRCLFAELGFELAFQSLFSEIKLQQRALDNEIAKKQNAALLCLRRLVKKACQSQAYPSLATLLTFIPNANALQQEAETSLENDNLAVELLTFHAAKGLEFTYVFIAGLDYQLKLHTSSLYYTDELGFVLQDAASAGLMRYASLSNIAAQISERQKTYAEELRLLYVALSRAIKQLYLYVDDFNQQDEHITASDELSLATVFQAKTYAALLQLALEQEPTSKRLANCLCGNISLAQVYKLQNLSLKKWLDCLAKLYLKPSDYLNWLNKQTEQEKQVNEDTATDAATNELLAERQAQEELKQAYQAYCQGETDLLQRVEFLSKQALMTANSEKTDKTPSNLTLTEQQLTYLHTWTENLSSLLTRLANLPNFNSSDIEQDISLELTEDRRLLLQNNLSMQREIDLSRDLAVYNSKYSVSGIKNLTSYQDAKPNMANNYAMEEDTEADLQYGLDLALQPENSCTEEFLSTGQTLTTMSLKDSKAALLTSDFADLVNFANAYKSNQLEAHESALSLEPVCSASFRGTLIHRFLQFVDLTKIHKLLTGSLVVGGMEASQIEKANLLKSLENELFSQLANLEAQGIIPKEASNVIEQVIPKLIPLYLSMQGESQAKRRGENENTQELYAHLSSAIQTGAVYREFPFVMEWQLEDFLHYFPELCQSELVEMLHNSSQKLKNELKISVQGVIDLWFQAGNEIYLIDYKTDYLSKEIASTEQALKDFFLKRYRVSMQLYALALKQGLSLSDADFKQHVHIYIYAVSNGSYVKLDL